LDYGSVSVGNSTLSRSAIALLCNAVASLFTG
jgi:hypothetical protein